VAKFGKQDYVSIAGVIRKTFDNLETTPNVVIWQVQYDRQATVLAFADAFAAGNERFDRKRFIAACKGTVTE
jgi:hypothetical protein